MADLKDKKAQLEKLATFLEQVKISPTQGSEERYYEACNTIKLYATLLAAYDKLLGHSPDAQDLLTKQLNEIAHILQEVLIVLRKELSK